MRSPASTILKRLTPLLAIPLLLGTPGEGSARSCTDSYFVCLNGYLDQGAVYEEIGSVECAARWAGCVLRAFRGG